MNTQETKSYDVVIVGAGISGAIIAKQLGLEGKKVLVMDSGAGLPPNNNDFLERFYNSPAKVPESPYTPDLFEGNHLADPTTLNAPRPTVLTLDASNWQDSKQSYLIQKGPLAFASTYERIAAGTVRHWLGTSLRNVPNDFRTKSVYDQMVDWPIGYDDVEPWYGLAEHEIGVSANASEQAYLGITFPPGYSYPMPKIPESLVDQAISAGLDGMQVDGIPLSVTSTPAGRNSQPYQGRRVCAGNTNCIPICPIQAKYDPSVTLNKALDTGNVDLWPQTVANEIIVDANGNVTQINYLQYATPGGPAIASGSVTAKRFVLAAHAIETPKLLLMSKNGGRTATGVANSSGLVGKNLMDHPLYLAWAQMPNPVFGFRGPLATSGIENLRDGAFRSQRAAYRIEIGNEGWNFSENDPYTTTVDMINGTNFGQLNPTRTGWFGTDLVNQLNAGLTRQFRLGFLVEQSPETYSYVTLSNEFKDNLGLPRPEIHYQFSDYTINGFISAQQTASDIFKQIGATEFTQSPAPNDPSVLTTSTGKRIKYYGAGHVVGTYCMGTATGNSVVDSDQRSWDHPNLFMVGSGVFPTVATANPTLTIAALALRAANTLKKELG